LGFWQLALQGWCSPSCSLALRSAKATRGLGKGEQTLCSLRSSSDSLKQICSGRAQTREEHRCKTNGATLALVSASAHPLLAWLCGPFSQVFIAAQTYTLQLLLVAGASQTLPCRSDRLRAGCGTIPRAGGVLRLSPTRAKQRVMPVRPSLSPPHPSGLTKVSARSSSGTENPDGAPEDGSCLSCR